MSDGIPFGGSAPQFPGSLTPDDIAALLGLTQDAPRAPARPDPSVAALLFDRAGMGGGLNPFAPREAPPGAPVAMNEADTQRLERGMMPPDAAAARAVPLPPARPSDADLMMPGPTTTGAVPQPAPPHHAASPAPAASADMRPVNAFDPLTGQVTSGQPQRLGAPGPAAQAPAAAQGQPQTAGAPDLFGKFLTGLQNPDVSNLLLNLGIGLMSQRGIGQGLAAGLKGYQDAGNNLTRQQLQQYQLMQQIQGQNAVRSALKGKVPDAMIEAAALNPTVLSSVLAQQNKDPQTMDVGGNRYLVPPGGRPGPENLLGPTAGPPSGFQPTPGGGLAPIEGGPESIGYKKQVSDATGKDQFVQVEQADGSKKPYLVDEDENGKTTLRPAPGLPETSGGGNPYATGKFNSDQAKAAGFSDRMLGSEPTLRKFETLNSGNAAQATIAGVLPNAMKSTERQQMDQAQRDFVNAQLRRESGAAISQGEFDNARAQYFPQAGDAPEVIAQKRRNRQTAIEAMAREGGASYRPKSVFDERGEIVPYGEGRQSATPAQPSRAQLEAEARRRGLIK